MACALEEDLLKGGFTHLPCAIFGKSKGHAETAEVPERAGVPRVR